MEKSLGEALPEEQARVREVLGVYKDLGLAGRFSAILIEVELEEADRAVMSGDLTAMLKAYTALKGCQ